MSEERLTLAAQESMVSDILRMAKKLEAQGDPYLLGQYMHLRERTESLLRILQIESAA